MDRDIAESLMTHFLSLDQPLNRAAEVADRISDDEERRAIRRAIGEFVGRIYGDLMRPIIRQYPDLGVGVDR